MSTVTPPKPGWILASDLNEDELEGMMLAGRLDPTKKWIVPPEAEVARAKAADAEKAAKDYAKAHPEIPKPDAAILRRIEAAEKVQSSFVATDKDGKVLDTPLSTAPAAPVAPKIDNPDYAGRPVEAPIDFADKERYLAHLLGGQNFTKSYDLFNGQLTVTFRTLSCSEQDQTARQIWLDCNHETSWAKDIQSANSERVARFAQYLFTAALFQIKAPGDVARTFLPFEEKGNPDAHILPIRAAHKKLQETFPWPVYRVLMNVHGEFCDLVNKLGNEAQNPSFWSPDAGT